MKKLLLSILFFGLALGVWFGIKYPAPTAMPKVLTQAEVSNQINKAVEGLQVRQAPATQTIIQQPMAGATIPVVVSLFETSLATKITSTANSMTLVSGVDSTGASLSGYLCFTLDEGSATAEFVCGTTSGTSVTSMTRGISPITGTSTVASLQFEHRRGASVKITNYPQLAIISRILNGNETLPNPIRYDSTISTSTLATNSNYLASVGFVTGIALQGAPTATTTLAGVVQIGTTAQIAAGTGMSGAYTLVPAGSLFSGTPRSATTVPVTGATGKLALGFLDLSADWSFTGTTTIAATTTKPIVLGGVSYAFPTTQGAATTALTNNGSGGLSWSSPYPTPKTGVFSKDMSGAGTTTIAHGLGRTPKYVRITAVYSPGGLSTYGLHTYSDGVFDGVTQNSVWSGYSGNGSVSYSGSDGSNIVHYEYGGQTGYTNVGRISVDGTNINIAWTIANSPTGSASFVWEAW